ncbi:MAG: 1,2-phenylacetyl-CoA epoxidase subunit PaaC [Bacteroidota bacterium]
MLSFASAVLFDYTLRLADNALILGHRLSEWCGHGPILEQDMAMTNIALDLIGQSRTLFQYAAELEGKGQDEDQLAYLRDALDFRNVLLVEHPNGDFGQTIVRQFFYDVYNLLNYRDLCQSKDKHLAAIAEKSLKEVSYHQRWSSEWMLRLGDGTELSHQKIQDAVDLLWPFTGELFEVNATDQAVQQMGIAPDLSILKTEWQQRIDTIFGQANITKPEGSWMQSGGKEGRHSEHLGRILAEMQYLQRAYPGQKWYPYSLAISIKSS